MRIRVVRTLGPGSRPAHRSQLLNFPFLHLLSHPRDLLCTQPGHVNPDTQAGTVRAPEPDTESLIVLRVSLILNQRQNRTACHYVPHDRLHNLPEHHTLGISKRQGTPIKLPETTLAAGKIIINPRPQSREVSSLLGAPGREEQGRCTGAISTSLLIRGHDVIHIAMVWPGDYPVHSQNGTYLYICPRTDRNRGPRRSGSRIWQAPADSHACAHTRFLGQCLNPDESTHAGNSAYGESRGQQRPAIRQVGLS
jgi:hypothetical protein